MTARLDLLCQGATAATRAAAFPADEPLEERELRRLADLAARLPRAGRILAAPGRAAGETAAALGLSVQREPAFSDLDAGRWRGQTMARVFEDQPQAAAAWMSDPDAAPHGGESIRQLVTRVGRWFDDAAPSGGILAIVPGAVMRAAVVHVLATEPRAFWSIDAGPLSVLQFSHDGSRWRLRCGEF